jgi:exodeoxyribonuclease-5
VDKNTRTLSPDQNHAIKSIEKWFKNFDAKTSLPYILTGAGGTGKTTVVKEIITQLGIEHENVTFLAPTNAALNKIKETVGETANYLTVARSLKVPLLRLNITTSKLDISIPALKTTERKLNNQLNKVLQAITKEHKAKYDLRKADLNDIASDWSKKSGTSVKIEFQNVFVMNNHPKFKDNFLSEYDPHLVVIDESSMLSQKDAQELVQVGLPILFIGDPNQIGAVNGQSNKYLFEQEENRSELTTNHRSTQHIQVFTDYIKAIDDDRTLSNVLNDVSVFQSFRRTKGRNELKRAYKEAIGTKTVLAFKNDDIKLANRLIRTSLRFKGDFFEPGEQLVFLTNSDVISNSDAATFIREVSTEEIKQNVTPAVAVYAKQNGIRLIEVESHDETLRVWVSDYKIEDHTRHEIDFWQTVREKQLLDTYKKFEKLAEQHMKTGFYDNSTVHLVSFGYARTIHKAQGQEWDTIIYLDDNRKIRTNKKLLYTAFSRAKEDFIQATL